MYQPKISLKNLATSSAQDVFDQVAIHLLTQNQPSIAPVAGFPTDCAYRGNNGLKCAAGCLIADDEYDIEIEGKDWLYLNIQGKVPTEHWQLITGLQGIHDSLMVGDSLKEALIDLATAYELNIDAITNY